MEQITSTPQPTDPPPQQTPQPPPATTSAAVSNPPSALPPPTSTSFPPPNPTPAPRPPITPQSLQSTTSQTRPPFNTRPWQQPPYSHFSLPSPPLPSSSASTSSSISAPPTPPPRGGIAIGVPAHNPSTPPPPPVSFSSLAPPSYGQQSQIRQPMQGIGMTSTLSTTSSIRPGGLTANQLRPPQSSLRPQTSPSGQSPTTQSFQGHGMLRGPSLGSPGAPSPSSSLQHQNQPWLSSGSQGKPPLPTPSLRPQTSPQSFQQRSHIPQQHQNTMSNTSQQQPIGSSQQSSLSPGQAQEHHGQPFPSSRIQQPLPHQQQITRGPGLGSQRPPLGMSQPAAFNTGGLTKSAETEESSSRIVSKRSIQELVNQIDPSEKLDPDVEDILMDIAEDFVESITKFGCSLAKHRKSTTLEAKDILLHLERNWNMTLPGFGGDEIKTFKKPSVSDIHRERLAAIKKSMAITDTPHKNSGGPSGGNTKGHLAKGPANIIGSPPNPKIREAA